jgi:hypothetical protein
LNLRFDPPAVPATRHYNPIFRVNLKVFQVDSIPKDLASQIRYCFNIPRSIAVEMPAVKSYPYKWGAALASLKRVNAFLPSALNHLEKDF